MKNPLRNKKTRFPPFHKTVDNIKIVFSYYFLLFTFADVLVWKVTIKENSFSKDFRTCTFKYHFPIVMWSVVLSNYHKTTNKTIELETIIDLISLSVDVCSTLAVSHIHLCLRKYTTHYSKAPTHTPYHTFISIFFFNCILVICIVLWTVLLVHQFLQLIIGQLENTYKRARFQMANQYQSDSFIWHATYPYIICTLDWTDITKMLVNFPMPLISGGRFRSVVVGPGDNWWQ